MRSKLRAIFGVTLLASTGFSAGEVTAADRSISIKNGGASPISEVYIYPVNKTDFGSDLLARSIPVGQTVVLRTSTKNCANNLKIVFKSGQNKRLRKVNLCSAAQIVVSEADYKIIPRGAVVKKKPEASKARPAPGAWEDLPPVVAELPPVAMLPTASRTFIGPDPLPPKGLGAYGIVAFPARIPKDTEKRGLMVCRAYWATLPEVSELNAPLRMQMVTVWPIDDQSLAAKLAAQRDVGLCEDAVRHYHLPTALIALKQANPRAGAFPGRGPYLLAWSPASKKGEVGAVVLIADLSSATTFDQFSEYFRKWREDIEQSPELWRNGWSIDGVRMAIRDWADRWGESILTTAAGSE